MALSVVLITKNEEQNIARTLASVMDLADEIILVDSGSTDRTLEIARSFGSKLKVFEEEWKGFARQKNSAIEKAGEAWILSLDADEEVSPELAKQISSVVASDSLARSTQPTATRQILPGDGMQCGVTHSVAAFSMPRKNFFLGRWIRHGGFYPDRKVRLVRREQARFEDRLVHEDMQISGTIAELHAPLLHHAYPNLTSYIEHMNRYSSLGAEMATTQGKRGFSLFNIAIRPWATFVYNYFLRGGFLDGREGLLLHLYHAAYVSWKYAKVWEKSRDA